MIGKVITEAPPRVRSILRDCPPELAAVADQCLSREQARRYQSAEEVAREVEAYLTGGNVRAYQYSSWELLRRFVQRHRALTAVSAGAVLLLIAALLVIRDEATRATISPRPSWRKRTRPSATSSGTRRRSSTPRRESRRTARRRAGAR